MKCPDEGKIDHNKDDGMTPHGSAEEPIKVLEMRPGKYIQWEYNHIDGKVTLPRRCLQGLLQKSGHKIDRIVVRDAGANHHVFYFDVTEQLDAMRRQVENAIEKLRRHRGELPPQQRVLLEALDREKKRLS